MSINSSTVANPPLAVFDDDIRAAHAFCDSLNVRAVIESLKEPHPDMLETARLKASTADKWRAMLEVLALEAERLAANRDAANPPDNPGAPTR